LSFEDVLPLVVIVEFVRVRTPAFVTLTPDSSVLAAVKVRLVKVATPPLCVYEVVEAGVDVGVGVMVLPFQATSGTKIVFPMLCEYAAVLSKAATIMTNVMSPKNFLKQNIVYLRGMNSAVDAEI